MLRTNSKQYRENWEKYLMEIIDPDEDYPPETLPDKLKWLANEFYRVAHYPYNLQRYPNVQARLADYLAGLPIHIDYTYYDIIKRAEQLHEVAEISEKLCDRIQQDWFNHAALMILRIADKHGVRYQ